MQIKHVGQYIKKCILDRGLKQKDIAEKVGMHPNSLNRFLKSESWEMDLFCKVSEAIGINPVEYFMDEGTCNPPRTSISTHEVTNVTNMFGTAIGKVANESANAEDKLSFLKTIINHQSVLIKEKESLIKEKERLISILLNQKESKEDNIE